MIKFELNPDEVILYKTHRNLYFYKNNSAFVLNRFNGSFCKLIITNERIVYPSNKFRDLFKSDSLEKIGVHGFEIKPEQIRKISIKNFILNKRIIIETNINLILEIEVSHFWDNSIIDAFTEFQNHK